MVFYPDREINLQTLKMIEDKTLSNNLCFLCLAHLNELIEYSKKNYDYLIPQRNTIAKALKENGVDVSVIKEKIMMIHKKSHLSLKRIKAVYDNILTGKCCFIDETIPDEYIQYKSAEEYKADSYRITRHEQKAVDDKIVQEIVEYIQNTFKCIPADRIKQESIKSLCKGIVTYEWILSTVKVYSDEIADILNKKTIESKGAFEYFLAVLESKLNYRCKYIKHTESLYNDFWRFNSYCVYKEEVELESLVNLYCEKEEYKNKELEVRLKIKKALCELTENESYRNAVERQREENALRNRPKAEYQRKTKDDKINERYKDLW